MPHTAGTSVREEMGKAMLPRWIPEEQIDSALKHHDILAPMCSSGTLREFWILNIVDPAP